jgi:hypothetical protein
VKKNPACLINEERDVIWMFYYCSIGRILCMPLPASLSAGKEVKIKVCVKSVVNHSLSVVD